MGELQEIETWVTALGQYDNQEFEEALRTFDTISDTAKILFNCGVIHATLGQHENAVGHQRQTFGTGSDQSYRSNALREPSSGTITSPSLTSSKGSRIFSRGTLRKLWPISTTPYST